MTGSSEFSERTGKLSFGDTIADFFAKGGALSKFGDFEWRPQQQQMAKSVAENLESNGHFIVEAGTGVGKSLAYLLPAIVFSKQHQRKAIITTHTINLQEQLMEKDIPLVRQILNTPLEAAILKGRQNYLCPARLHRALANAASLFESEQTQELEKLRLWSLETTDGTLNDIPSAISAEVWNEVCSEPHLCTPRTCGDSSRCFYQQARKRANKAEILILNHSLFFTLLMGMEIEDQLPGNGYLFPNDFAIFDEAHYLENIASQIIGLRISQYGLQRALYRLYNPRTKKGLFPAFSVTGGREEILQTLDEVQAFFEDIQHQCAFEKGGREFRIREPHLVDGSVLTEGLIRVGNLINTFLTHCENEEILAEFRDARRRLLEIRQNLSSFLSMSSEAYVYWVEQSGRTGQSLTLHAAPVDSAHVLHRFLFREGSCATLTSATLSIGKPDLSYFRNRIGAQDVPSLSVGSPFDYPHQMKLHIVKNIPDPRESTYETALAKWVLHFVTQSKGRAFVLFTSHRTLRHVAEQLESTLNKNGWPLIAQGMGTSRSQMITDFRTSGTAVLFGTDSFWSGVDVPGDCLSNVIITRLPFAQPGHPLTEAKMEQIMKTGGNAFQDYSLPEAILKLRQGVGRLIRTHSDRGIVVLLDNRVATKTYGKAFLNALPKCPIEYH